MSNANAASNATGAACPPIILEAPKRLATFVAETLVAVVLARAVWRAHRELAPLGGRIADIGLDHATVEDLAAIDRWEHPISRAQLPPHRLHTRA